MPDSVSFMACRCGRPLEKVDRNGEYDDTFGGPLAFTMDCPEHGPIIVSMVGGQLDLGVVRGEAPPANRRERRLARRRKGMPEERQNDFSTFTETYEGLR